MNVNCSKNALLGLLVLTPFLLLLFSQPASADGVGWIQDPDMAWRFMPESKQFAVINYEQGVEKLLLTVEADLRGEKAVWIFPVPAEPEQTRIDVLAEFPYFYGQDVFRNSAVSSTLILASASQAYLALPLFLYALTGVGGTMGVGTANGALNQGVRGFDGIDVFQEVQREGLTTQVLAARDGSALYSYLKEKNLSVSPQAKSLFEYYSGKKYSFVVSWISNLNEFKAPKPNANRENEAIGVFVSFPTEKMFFPLKLTSIYGDARIPVVLYVLGHVTPNLDSQILSSQVGYYYQQSLGFQGPANTYEDGRPVQTWVSSNANHYTKISIDAPASSFTQDLYIEDTAPARIALEDYARNNFWGIFLILFALICCAASMLAALIVFSENRPNLPKFALLGLFNVFTVFGLYFAASKLKIENNFVEFKDKRKSTGNSNYWIIKKGFVAAFILTLALLGYVFSQGFQAPKSPNELNMFAVLVILTLVLVWLAVTGLLIGYCLLFSPERFTKTQRFACWYSALFLALCLAAELIAKRI